MIKSTIGKKVVVALTGLVLFGFILGHLTGNLLIFAGPEMYNHYAAALKAKMPLLWAARAVLLTCVILHIVFTIQLARLNRLSRPIGYHEFNPQQANISSRIMIWSGLLLGAFIVYHLLHFTFGSLHPQFSPHDVYTNVVLGFQVKTAAIFYILAMISLGLHLHHGVWSVFQTLGLNHPKYNCARRVVAAGASIVITLGFISIPVAVMAGVIH